MMTHIIKRAKKLTKSYFQHRKSLKKPEIKKAVTQKLGITCLVSLLATCQPSYAESGQSLFGNVKHKNDLKSFKSNSDFLTELKKINQLSFFDSFNYVAKVAVTGNNLKQELRNLLKTVQHHTIVGVFFCLSFASLPVMGELCLAFAVVRLWWGGRGNKPLGANTVCRLFLAVSNLPTALTLGQIIKTSLPFEKV